MTRGDLVSLVGSVAPFFMCLSSPTRFATHLILRWLSVLKNDLITIILNPIYHHVLTVCFVFRLRTVFLVLDALPVVPGVKNQTVKKTNDDSIFYAGTALAELVYSVP